jgi:hypothetical protein
MGKRAGKTIKISISIDHADLALLKKRAKRMSGGSVSAAIADAIRVAVEWEAREELARWLGEGRAEPSPETMDAIRAEWYGKRRRTRKTA